MTKTSWKIWQLTTLTTLMMRTIWLSHLPISKYCLEMMKLLRWQIKRREVFLLSLKYKFAKPHPTEIMPTSSCQEIMLDFKMTRNSSSHLNRQQLRLLSAGILLSHLNQLLPLVATKRYFSRPQEPTRMMLSQRSKPRKASPHSRRHNLVSSKLI